MFQDVLAGLGIDSADNIIKQDSGGAAIHRSGETDYTESAWTGIVLSASSPRAFWPPESIFPLSPISVRSLSSSTSRSGMRAQAYMISCEGTVC